MTTTERILSQCQVAQKLIEGATAGPWEFVPGDGRIVGDGGDELVARMRATCATFRWSADGELLAASRTLVPRLARQLEEAVKALEEIRATDGRLIVVEAVAREALSRIEQIGTEEK